MIYRPTFRSFLGSALYGLSPAAVAGVFTYLSYDSASLWLWVLDAVVGLISIFLLLQAVFVYRQQLYLDETAIATAGPLGRQVAVWPEVTSAVLRERPNLLTRTDRLLVIEAPRGMVTFNISTLSPEDEREVLERVQACARLVIHRDKPSI